MSARFEIKVGGLHSIPALVREFRPTHLLGILDPPTPQPAIYDHDALSRATLLLRFHDVDDGRPDGPTVEHVEKIIAFADQVRGAHARTPARLLVHCHAGISRSTASAYIALARDLGLERAADAFRQLLRVTSNPWPNRRLVALADEALGAKGRLLAPLDAYRDANIDRLESMMAYHRLLIEGAEADKSDPPRS
jgi:predicted protein tyrosine phosphatase